MIRCVVRPEQIQRETVTLDARQTKHLVTVLRLRPGDSFLIWGEAVAPRVAQL